MPEPEAMSLDRIAEKDGKVFRELRGFALERFCRRVLEEVAQTSSNELLSFHERYLNVYRLLDERDSLISIQFGALRHREKPPSRGKLLRNTWWLSWLKASRFKPPIYSVI